MLEDDNKIRIKYKDGAEVKLPNKGLEALKKEAPEVVKRMGYEEGGSIDNQMKMALNEPDMLPDEVMEDNYMELSLIHI